MFNPTRTPVSNHGETSQSGGAGRRRITTPPSAKGVGSRTKEASGARSRNSSRRSKIDNVRWKYAWLAWCWSFSNWKRAKVLPFASVYGKCVKYRPQIRPLWHGRIKFTCVLCSHRSGDEKKEKGGEKTPENQNNVEHETAGKTPKLVHLEINRGTAVWTPLKHCHGLFKYKV